MKKVFLGLAMIVAAGLTYSQARLMLNNSVRVVMDNGVFIVLDNANTNAITKLGTMDGTIVSEDEDNKVRWNIGTATGSYTVPFGDDVASSGQEIPTTFQITGAGVGSGRIDFSVYETTTDMNSPWPSMVTHMFDAATGTVDNSLYVIDRFWMIDATNYTTEPSGNLTLTYVNTAAELGGTNLLTEANLVAQRFNSALSEWNGDPAMTGGFYGTVVNTGTRQAGPFFVGAGDLFETWTLSDNTSLLPVELLDMNVLCDGRDNIVRWSTASETNSDYFTVERSEDGVNYQPIAQLDAAGTSSSTISYSFKDDDAPMNTVYYRLRQTDLDGSWKFAGNVLPANCGVDGTDLVGQFIDGSQIGLQIQTGEDQDITIEILDASGRMVDNSQHYLREGFNQVMLNYGRYERGIYLVNMKTDTGNILRKVYLNR